jgi:hypothetical protein
VAVVDVEALGEVLMATRLVTGSAVKRMPSMVEEMGAVVVMRMLLSFSIVET